MFAGRGAFGIGRRLARLAHADARTALDGFDDGRPALERPACEDETGAAHFVTSGIARGRDLIGASSVEDEAAEHTELVGDAARQREVRGQALILPGRQRTLRGRREAESDGEKGCAERGRALFGHDRASPSNFAAREAGASLPLSILHPKRLDERALRDLNGKGV